MVCPGIALSAGRAAHLSSALEAETLTRDSSAAFNSCYPLNEKVIWKKILNALHKPQKHARDGQASA